MDATVSPEGVAHLSQHRLLPLLHAQLTARDTVRFAHRVVGLQQHTDLVHITAESQASLAAVRGSRWFSAHPCIAAAAMPLCSLHSCV